MKVINSYKDFQIRISSLGIVYLCFFVIFPNIIHSQNSKNRNISGDDFDNVANQNSVKYSEYDSYEFQFQDFFGLSNPLNEVDKTLNYQDLTVEFDSENIRSLYFKKLKQMTNLNNIKQNETNWNFYDEKI